MKKFDRPPIHSPTSYEYRNLIAQSAGTEANNSEVRNKELPLLPLNSTRSLRATVQKSWLWEILTYCFSLVCMIAVIAVLIFEHGKQLDQWAFPIGPNAMISFIITLAKSSFLLAMTETISQLKWLHYNGKSNRLSDLKLFDEASRGPVGSLRLLFAKNKSNTVLASSAAIVVIAALFVDPFVQLVFHFPSRRALAPIQNAAFQIAQVYNPSHQVDTQHYVGKYYSARQACKIGR